MIDKTDKQLIGRAEKITFRSIEGLTLRARIDTGAKTSSVSAQNIHLQDGVLYATFFDESNSNKAYEYGFESYDTTAVASSNGHIEIRYKVKIKCELLGRVINASFTLTDRSMQVYPVLVGRNILRGKFIVDVKRGKPFRDRERIRTQDLRSRIEEKES